jgi:hypothetical protein
MRVAERCIRNWPEQSTVVVCFPHCAVDRRRHGAGSMYFPLCALVRRSLLPGAGGLLFALAAYLLPLPAFSDTHYVALTGGHVPPFTNWADAATDIQSAVDEASPGDVALVSNGVYDRSSPDLPAKRL